MAIPFNRPHVTGKEADYIRQVIENGKFAGNGMFSGRCARWIEEKTGCGKAIITPSGTAALEMMMILANIGPGDEVIMPSFTFSSTANSVVLRGASPVFTDIRPDTLNMDENLIESAITPKTKAILPVHYAGVGCEMDAITTIAAKHGLLVLEDAAQCILSHYKGRPLGRIGQMGALSFHETKNIHCGEGGALLINDPAFAGRAEVVMEKGTDRSKFFRGEVDKYTWVDVGSSCLVNEMTAAFLWAQLEEAETIIAERRKIWLEYHDGLALLEENGFMKRPVVMDGNAGNAHIYYILLPDGQTRDELIRFLRSRNITAVFHYVPLHSAPFCASVMELKETDSIAGRLLRLPLYIGVNCKEVIRSIYDFAVGRKQEGPVPE